MKSKPSRAKRPSLFQRYPLLAPALFVLAAIAYAIRGTLWPFLGVSPPLGTKSRGALNSCNLYNYTTEIVSIDPLLIYINNFVSPRETDELMHLA